MSKHNHTNNETHDFRNVNELTLDEMSVDKMPADEMSVDDFRRNDMFPKDKGRCSFKLSRFVSILIFVNLS